MLIGWRLIVCLTLNRLTGIRNGFSVVNVGSFETVDISCDPKLKKVPASAANGEVSHTFSVPLPASPSHLVSSEMLYLHSVIDVIKLFLEEIFKIDIAPLTETISIVRFKTN